MKKRWNLIDARKRLFLSHTDLGNIIGKEHTWTYSVENCLYNAKPREQEILEKYFSIPREILFKVSDIPINTCIMQNSYEIRGDVTAIFIKSKKYGHTETIIDTLDLPRAMQITRWSASYSKNTKSIYVRSTIRLENGKETTIKLHRWLYENLESHLEIDHKYLDTLDNRRSYSLRVVTPAQNTQNRSALRNNKSSGIRGVYHVRGKWRAKATINGVQTHFGYFESKHEAEDAIMKAREKLMPFSKEALAK